MPLLSLSVSQLLLAFVSASILHKLTFNSFFLKWLASHRFECALLPTNNELRRLKDRTREPSGGKRAPGKQKSKLKKEFNIHPESKDDVFKIPVANLDSLKLDKTTIGVSNLESMYYAVDLEWIVDLAFMSLFTLALTEIQFYFYPQANEYNFSLLWCLLVVVYCVKTLWKLTAIYFKNEKSIGERSVCIISGCFFLLIAMITQMVDEKRLELGLDDAYRSFTNSTGAEVKTGPSSRTLSLITFKFSTVILCSLIGVLFTFPGLRFGQLHVGLLDKPSTSRIAHIIYTINFLSPLFIIILWIKPISRDLFKNQDLLIIDDIAFDTIRIYSIITFSLFRFYLLPRYVSMFLSSSSTRIARLRFRGGTVTNREIQMTISGIYNYVNVISIQYILPILMCLFTSIMFTTMGGHKWIPSLDQTPAGNLTLSESPMGIEGEFSGNSFMTQANNESIVEFVESNNSTFSFLTEMINFSEIKRQFSAEVFRGIFGFATWWLHLSWFCTTTTGVIYHTYFLH